MRIRILLGLFFLPHSWRGLLLLCIISCGPKKIKTYRPFTGFPESINEEKVGTPDLWGRVYHEANIDGKSRALILDHGEESLLLRINLIRSAKKSISVQTFSWEFDEVGKFILWYWPFFNQNIFRVRFSCKCNYTGFLTYFCGFPYS